MDASTIINIILSILSFILAAISVITVIITLRQNREMLNNTEKQLEEMRREHQLSVQPVVAIEDVQFNIERPRFFYTPPSDEYSFHSRYYVKLKLHNISDTTAVCIDARAYITITKGDKNYQARTIVHREKVLSEKEKSTTLTLRFNSDRIAALFEGLRGMSTKELPQLVICITYRNAVGGCFSVSETYLIVPNDEENEIIRKWHTCIKSAPVEAKEILDTMQQMPHDDKWDQAFEVLKKAFDEELEFTECNEIVTECIELDEKYSFDSLSEEKYKELLQNYSYSRFMHKQTTCAVKTESTNSR